MVTRRIAIAALTFCISACGSRPVFWDDLDTPWTMCSGGDQISMNVEWLDDGHGLRLLSEPGAPELRFRGASSMDEYYSGDGYRLEIQVGPAIELKRPDGGILYNC